MKVSVIIPVYNGADKLTRCLDSLRGQTLRDIEMIFVDDASSDGTAELLAQAAREDARIRVITHTENLTASVSRNEGIRAAQGEYITFVDGDDALLPQALEKLVANMERDPVDVLQFGTQVVNTARVAQSRIDSNQRMLEPYRRRLKDRQVFLTCFRDKKYSFNIWGKLYAAPLCKRAVEHLTDRPMAKAQDVYLYWALAWFARSYRSVKKRYYQYYFGDGLSGRQSIGLTQYRRVCACSKVAEELRRFMEIQDPEGTYKAVLKDRCDALIAYCVNVLMEDVAQADRPECFRILAHAWSLETTLAELSQRYLYDTRQIIQDTDFFRCLPEPKAGPVKTVGMYYYSIYNGGVQRIMADLSWILTRQGYRVVLFTDRPAQAEDYRLPEGVERIVIPDGNESYEERARAWTRELAAHPVDVMVYHAWLNRLLLWDMLLIRRAGVRCVIHTQSIAFVPMMNMMNMAVSMPYVYRMADGIIALSRTDQHYWSKFNPHVFLVNNPMDPALLKQGVSSLEHKRILWVGRLSEEKQPLEAVRIMARVHAQHPEAKLSILGSSTDGVMEDKLKKLIASQGLKDVVELPGFSREVGPYYLTSDVFLMTSAYEGYSLTLQESKCLGVPCVAYDMPYLELFRLPQGGLVSVPQRDAHGAAQAICRLLEDADYRRSMGADARRSIQQVAQVDLGARWTEIFAGLDAPGCAEIDRDGEEKLMLETWYGFLTGNRSSKEVGGVMDVRAVYSAMPWLLRKVAFAWQVQHDLGWKRLFSYALEKIKR